MAVYNPVAAVLPGRRNNPPEGSIRSLAVFNPIQYFELPELFMELICSMTGKSPSTTGAGSEGALTKGPFNALPPIIDLNNALVSWLLTGHHAFVTAAGYVGPRFRVDHDISLLVPEVWCRMRPAERDPQYLIANHFLEKCEDFEHEGSRVLAGRLGYRINVRFVHAFFGRVFNHPSAVFTDEMLRPELQGLEAFVDGLDNIITTQRRIAQMYFDDGSVARACPPLKALLHIMRDGQFEGCDLGAPELRRLFTRETLLASDWYRARLKARQLLDRALWRRHVAYLDRFLKRTSHADEAARLDIAGRLARSRQTLNAVEQPSYVDQLPGYASRRTAGSIRRLKLVCDAPERHTRSLLHRLNPAAARLLVRFELQQAALLRFQEHVVKRTEPVSALVETRVAALDRLLDHRTPDRLVRLALLGDGFQRFHHQVKGLFQRRPGVLAFGRLRGGGARRRCAAARAPALRGPGRRNK